MVGSMTIKRRDFLYFLGASVGSLALGNGQATANSLLALPTITDLNQENLAAKNSAFTLPPLPYAYDALEPYIDTKTMQFHHDKHHAAYVKNLNDAIAKHPELRVKTAEDLLRNLATLPEDIRVIVRNNGGGHLNHSMFWEIMGPKAGGNPKGAIDTAIKQAFGSFDGFKQKFNEIGNKRFGSGWVWLVRTKEGKLKITSTPNQDSPFIDGDYPILGNDVWEHAYYLLYQNRRADYLKSWWNVVNWEQVNKRYQMSMG